MAEEEPKSARVRGTDYQYEGMTVVKELFPPETLDRIKDTVFDDSDILIATYPKCGTNWMQEIIYQVFTDGDFEGSDKVPLYARFHFLEMTIAGGLDRCQSEAPPRLLKTHLSSDFFKKNLDEKKTKVIVVLRNPKDVLVSYFHFYRMANFDFDQDGTWEEFFERFRNDKISHGNFFDVCLSWWKYKDDPRVAIFKFEDMIKDPAQAVQQVAAHLNKKLSDDLVQKIVERTSFKSMKANPMLNFSTIPTMDHSISPFMRKGQVGDWKNYFTEEQRSHVDNLSKLRLETVGLFLEDECVKT